MRFRNRTDAGRQLAHKLIAYRGRADVLVLGLPRGGVPVAAEVAKALGAPLDVFLVRKLGVPQQPELAMGAIAEGGVKVINESIVEPLGLTRDMIERIAVRERIELDRRDVLYRGGRQAPSVRDRTVILIDDGLATGATMEAAVMALRQLGPTRIVVAVPVGAAETVSRLAGLADAVVCVQTPEPMHAVGAWYEDFNQTTDEEVKALLAAAGHVSTSSAGHETLAYRIRQRAIPLAGDLHDYDALLRGIGDARIVLIGEATHGTHEFYRERAVITRRLIETKGFNAVAVEADWPDAYRVNRFVRGVGGDADTVDALADFQRFPAWMWRNADVLNFIGWLRTYNLGVPDERRAGFYGLDLYSLRASMNAVLTYLRKVDPDAARIAQARYACFDRFGADMQDYAYTAGTRFAPSCEREVVTQLVDLQRHAADYARRDGRIAADEYFFAEQNARLVKNAEDYYRAMLGGRSESWNVRDRHMVESLVHLVDFLGNAGRDTRVVVWAHNSHLGDARATEMGEAGEINVGQLTREAYGGEAVLIGFTTHTGSVTAASEWDGPALRKAVRPSLPGSYERLFHEVGLPRFLLPLRADLDLADALAGPRLERAIGVIYLPESERRSHYFRARLRDQFDFVLHFDETRAVEPLERSSVWEHGEVAETYPTGL